VLAWLFKSSLKVERLFCLFKYLQYRKWDIYFDFMWGLCYSHSQMCWKVGVLFSLV